MKKRFLDIGLAAALVLYAATSAFGQAISGDLVGVVNDAMGGTVANAALTLKNESTGVSSSATTNGSGEYRFGNLLVGNYSLTVQAPGFAGAEVKGIDIDLNKTVTQNVMLKVASVSTTIDVTEAPAVIDTTTAQVEQTFTDQQAQQIPMASTGNGVINLSLLQAGVASSGGVGYGAGPSIGGQRPTSNSFTIEGTDNNDKSVTGPILYIANENIAEFTLLQNEFRAEYGHSSGGQFNTVIKSGGNTLHGALYEYFENRDLFALDQAFANQGILSVPRFDQSHLGMNLGGPIKKNKWFIFGGLEYNPTGQASTSGSVIQAPTAAGYAALAAAPGVNQTNLKTLQQYAIAPAATAGAPNVTVGGVTVPTGVVNVSGPSFVNNYYGVVSSDYNLSEKDQFRARYLYNKGDGISTVANLPDFWTGIPNRYHLASLAEYHVFSPAMVNELRLGYYRELLTNPVGSQTFPGLDAFPNLKFDDINLQVGPNPNYPQGSIRNGDQFADTFTWTKGSHTVKVGYEFHDYISATQFTQNVRGSYEYSTLGLYLTDQYPDVVNLRSVGNPTYYGNNLANYMFGQDTWRITPRLTIDLGLRYERNGVSLGERQQSLNALASVPGLIDFRAPKPDSKGFGPRIGVAWSLDSSGSTVVRAGFSRATDVIYDNIGVNGPPPQFTTSVSLTGATGNGFLQGGGISAAKYQPGVLTPALARAATASYFPDWPSPYSLNWTLAIEKVVAKNYTFEARYVGTRGIHQLIQTQMNRLHPPVNANTNIPTFFDAPSAAVLASLPYTVGQLRPSVANGNLTTIGANGKPTTNGIFLDPQWIAAGFASPITSYTPQGWSDYHGLALDAKRRFADGLQLLASYTWSRNIDNSTATLATSALSQRRAQDSGNLSPEKSSSALDRRHRLTIQTLYDVPWQKGSRNWFAKNLIGNWEVVPVYTYESPEYFTVYSGTNGNFNGDAGTLYRSVINPNGAAGTASGVYGLDRNGNVIASTASAASVNTVVAWVAKNSNARYVQAAAGAFANGGRNTEPTRPINNVDITLLKRFTFRERYNFETSMQAYNMFNHPQFIPGSIDNTARVSTNASTAYTTLTNALFNNPEKAFSSNPRVVQLVAKFTF